MPRLSGTADASPAYSTVYIGGTTVTDEENTTTIKAGEGTAVWNPASAVLTLENATFSDYILIHISDTTQTVKVILKGENKIDISSSNIQNVSCALTTNCALEIEEEGNAALNITTNFDSNDSYGQNAVFTAGTLRIKSDTLNLRSAWQTIFCSGDTPIGATADPASAKIEYSYTGDATGNGWPTNAGTYTVIAKVEVTGNYGAATATATLTINGAAVTPKTYTGTKDATITSATLSGMVNGETLALGTDYTATGEFDSASAGTGKSVTVTLTSAKANNYTLANGGFS